MTTSIATHPPSYANCKLIELYKSKEWTDCVFIVAKERILVHKFHLALCSPVFESMLYGIMASNEIRIDDIHPKEFHMMLDYLYTEKLALETVEDACKLLYVAQKYLLQDLMCAAKDYIKNNLNLFNLAMCFEYGQLYGATDLLQTCLSDMLAYAVGVLFFTDYHMKGDNFKCVLKESAALENVTRILAAVKWALEELELSNCDTNADNLMNCLREYELLTYLDFAKYQKDVTDEFNVPNFDLLHSYARLFSNGSQTIFCNFPRVGQQKLNYKYRKLLKSSHAIRIRGRRRESVRSAVISQKTVLLFGIAISTKSSPSLLNSTYKGNVVITISDTDGRVCSRLLSCSENATYDNIQHVRFNIPPVLQKLKEYFVDVSYECDESYEYESVLLSYMSSSIKPCKFSSCNIHFYDGVGSVIHGFSIYEL